MHRYEELIIDTAAACTIVGAVVICKVVARGLRWVAKR